MAAPRQVRHIIVQTQTSGSQDIKALAQQMGVLNKTTRDLRGSIKNMGSIFQTVFAAGVFSFGIGQITQMIDATQQLNDRISILVGEGGDAGAVFNDLFERANRVRVPLNDMASTFARITAASQQTGLSIESLTQLTETLAQTFILSGSSAQEANAASIQLTQGIAAGVLRGEEFNSVLEQNLYLGQLLAKQISGGNVGALRAMAKEGKLVNSTVLGALAKGAQEVDSKFSTMRVTIGQGVTVAFNMLTKAVNDFNEKTNIGSGIGKAIIFLGKNLDVLGVIVLGLATTAIPLLAAAAVKLFGVIKAFVMTNPLTLALTAVGAAVYLIYKNIDRVTQGFYLLKANVLEVFATLEDYRSRFVTGTMDFFGIKGSEKVAANAVKNIEDLMSGAMDARKKADEYGKKADKQAEDSSKRMSKLLKDLTNLRDTGAQKEKKSKEMLADLNQEYLRGALSVQQYYDTLDNTRLEMLNKDFRDGKKDLFTYNEEMRAMEMRQLNRDLKDGSIGLLEFNSRLNEISNNGAWDKFRAGKSTLQELNTELANTNSLSTLESMTMGVAKYYQEIGTYSNAVITATASVMKSLEDEAVDFLMRGEATWEKFANNIIEQLARITYQMLIAKPIIESVMSYLVPGGGGAGYTGGGGGGMAQTVQANAKGNAFGSSGVIPFASGGVVNSPTLFGFGKGNMGVMGEAGAEAILPLRRGSNGDLGVQATTAPVYVVINNNAGADVSTSEYEGPGGERILEVTVNNIVKRGIQSGAYDTAMGSSYNLRRKGS